MLPRLSDRTTAEEARATLAAAGWEEVGVGDWAWVLAAPDDGVVARVTPFDPAFRLFADTCVKGPPNPFLVRVDEIIPLRHRGYIVIMERLHPADDVQAQRLVAALTGEPAAAATPPAGSADDLAHDADIVDLRRRLGALSADGERRFRLWGGADIKPANILQAAGGRLRVTDPVFIRGMDVFEAIRDRDADRLGDFSRADLQDFLSIPVFPPGAETEALRQKVDALRGLPD